MTLLSALKLFCSSSGALKMFFTHLPGYTGCMRDVTFNSPTPLYLTSAVNHFNVDFELPCDFEVDGIEILDRCCSV